MPDQQKRLGDDRSDIGEDFQRAQTPADRSLGQSFEETNSSGKRKRRQSKRPRQSGNRRTLY